MKSIFVFCKRLAVLLLSRRYFDSVDLAEYWAGLRHLLGLRIDFAIPRLIPFVPINQLDASAEQSLNNKNLPGIGKASICNQRYSDGFSASRNSQGLFAFRNAVITNQYGMHDLQGRPVLGSVLTRGHLEDASSYPNGYPRTIPLDRKGVASGKLQEIPRAFYITYMFLNHIGHELTEVISAVHPLLAWRGQGEDFSCMSIVVHQQFAKFLGLLSDVLGLDEDHFLVPGLNCGPLLVKTACFAPPSFVLKNFVSPQHHRYVKDYFELVYGGAFLSLLSLSSAEEKKIYISRSRIGFRQRQFLQEKDLERELEGLGWTIFHPQERTRFEQLQAYQMSTHICALEGSALHFLLGINSQCLDRVVLLAESQSNDFVLQLISQGIPYDVISCLEKDTYPPLVRNNANVRLRDGFDPCSLARLIDSSALSGLSR